jgi:3-methylcrotonyl-CoA carboxylase alpha subunit
VISSVLIANRGEIACRIIRTARRLGLRTVAVHSEADRGAMFVAMADEAHAIGGSAPADSYLRIDRIMEAAHRSGVEAIHPGYGFLSERAEFADACAEAGIVFVGPPASAIRAMGLKDAAKALVSSAGVPVVPGYHGSRQEPDFLRQKAYEIGYPVLIKAVAGGGGKGMRRVDKALEFEAALESAQREAVSAFGDGRVLVEKYVLAPRHIEVQVFGDRQGNVVHLFERDCSLQRRHQKVIEEAPAPGMTAAMRAAMGGAAVEAARAVGYVGAGTVEFIADSRDGLRPDRFFFMEMNTRLQVEHPVTEAITGLDLVELQLRVASGEPLPFGQDDLAIGGHAVEARLYAEDPERGFLPSTGRLWALRFPQSDEIRIDTGVREGDEVTPFYDPMVAKIIAHGADRDEALDRLSAALSETVVAGPKTNAAFLAALCDADGFRSGAFDTGFIDRNLQALGAVEHGPDHAAAALGAVKIVHDDLAALRRIGRGEGGPASPWDVPDGFQLVGARTVAMPILVDGVREEVAITWPPGAPGDFEARIGDRSERPSGRFQSARDTAFAVAPTGTYVLEAGRQTFVQRFDPFAVDLEHLDAGDTIAAPMHGKLVAVFVAPGDPVKKGQRLAVLEAMKMEHALLAPRDGEVAEVIGEPGQQVADGARLIVLAAAAEVA